MDHNKAGIVIHSGNVEPERLTNAQFHFAPDERSLYAGADNTGAIVQRAGWLGIRTAPFSNWLGSFLIELRPSNDPRTEHMFEVTRSFHQPLQDGEWLWFPVKPVVVTAYSDHD